MHASTTSSFRRTLRCSRTIVSMALLSALGTVPAHAANFSFTGELPQDNAIQPVTFQLINSALVTFRTCSYAGGNNAAGAAIPEGGFDPVVSVFRTYSEFSHDLLGDNDDGASVPSDPSTGFAFDSLQSLKLGPGKYVATVTQFDNTSWGAFYNYPYYSGGFARDDNPNFAGGFGGRSANWALDILGVDSASQLAAVIPNAAIPEPETYLLMLCGLGAVGAAARRRRLKLDS